MKNIGDYDEVYEIDGGQFRVIEKVDTSRHDSRFQKRVAELNGLYKVEEVNTGKISVAYGIELGR